MTRKRLFGFIAGILITAATIGTIAPSHTVIGGIARAIVQQAQLIMTGADAVDDLVAEQFPVTDGGVP